jgi:hypothetical protein
MNETSDIQRIGHQHNCRAGEGSATETTRALADNSDDQRPNYYCRGCGGALRSGFRGHFHKECLRADKRRRIQARRRGEQGRFEDWLQKQYCHNCGARYAEMRSESFPGGSCEASQAAQERDTPAG